MALSSSVPRAVVSLAIGMFGLLPPARALAQATSSEALVEERRNLAKSKFEQGVEAYRAHLYVEAVRWFLAAEQIAPSPPLSFNIARAYERLNDTSGALRWYRDYLRRLPQAANATDVRARIALLAEKLSEQGVQQLTVLSSPPAASVAIDGRAAGVTPYTGDLRAGVHRLTVSLPGYRELQSDVVLQPGKPRDFSVKLLRIDARLLALSDSSPASPISVSATRDGHRVGPRRFGVLPWVVAGTGGVLLGAAIGLELARRSEESDAADAVTQIELKQHLEAIERRQLEARVLAGVGGALLVTGGALLLFNDRREQPMRVGFGCVSDGCVATARGAF